MASQPKKRFRVEKIGTETVVDYEAPFLGWFAAYCARGQGECRSPKPSPNVQPAADFIMGELASRRFSVGLDDDGTPVLGVADGDVSAVMSLPWNGAAFLRRVQNRDWVALSCRDGRVAGAKLQVPFGARLWLPATAGLLDAWKAEADEQPKPSSLRILETVIQRGRPLPKGEAPLATLPLSFKGSW